MNNSILFQYLLERYNDESLRSKTIYIQNDKEITVSDLYQLVLKYIDEYKSNKPENPYFLLVLNDIDSVAKIIALLECGITPILINGYDYYIKKNIGERKYDKNNKEIGILKKEVITTVNHVKFDKKKRDVKKGIIVGEPGVGKIGICTSGTLGDPKLIYIPEKRMVENTKKSKNNNPNRKIYNHLTMSSVSSLFTNVFLPICSKSCQARLTNKFEIMELNKYTDVILPRNYRELLTFIEKGNIENIYLFGEANNKDAINFIKNRIIIKDPELRKIGISFINAYGSTELGGLVSEYDIKNENEITIYDYDIDKDMVVFSYDDTIYLKKEKDKVDFLSDDEIQKINNGFRFRLLPCGTTDDSIKIKNINIGEGLIGDYHTGDIFITMDHKLYVLGRESDLVNHTSLSYLDNRLSEILGRKCTAFVKDDDIYIAVKFDLSNEVDQTCQFRYLTEIYKEIEDAIYDRYPKVKDVLIIPDKLFPLSSTLKKSKRKDLDSFIDYNNRIKYRLENFNEIFVDYFEKTCMNYIDRIPSYSINEERSIVIPCKEINEEELVELLAPLRIVAIEKKRQLGSYILYFDDSYFFELDDKADYTPMTLKQYRELAKKHVFLPKFLYDNREIITDMKYDTLDKSSVLKQPVYIAAAVGQNSKGFKIIYPYYASIIYNSKSAAKEFQNRKKEINRVFRREPYKHTVFFAYVGFFWNLDDSFLSMIAINPQGIILGDDEKRNLVYSFYHYGKPYVETRVKTYYDTSKEYIKKID